MTQNSAESDKRGKQKKHTCCSTVQYTCLTGVKEKKKRSERKWPKKSNELSLGIRNQNESQDTQRNLHSSNTKDADHHCKRVLKNEGNLY